MGYHGIQQPFLKLNTFGKNLTVVRLAPMLKNKKAPDWVYFGVKKNKSKKQ